MPAMGIHRRKNACVTTIFATQVLYNTAIRARRREQIDQLLYAPENIQPECLERLHRSVTVTSTWHSPIRLLARVTSMYRSYR